MMRMSRSVCQAVIATQASRHCCSLQRYTTAACTFFHQSNSVKPKLSPAEIAGSEGVQLCVSYGCDPNSCMMAAALYRFNCASYIVSASLQLKVLS